MKSDCLVFRRAAKVGVWLTLLSMLVIVNSVRAAYYQAGDVITNFTLYARPAWTNAGGFGPNAPMQLSDFAGKIVFVEFFDPT